MIIKNGLVWEESGSFLTKDLHIDSDTHRKNRWYIQQEHIG